MCMHVYVVYVYICVCVSVCVCVYVCVYLINIFRFALRLVRVLAWRRYNAEGPTHDMFDVRVRETAFVCDDFYVVDIYMRVMC